MLQIEFVPPPPIVLEDTAFVPGELEPDPIDEEELARIRLGSDGGPHCD